MGLSPFGKQFKTKRKPPKVPQIPKKKGWIGVDLDGTLAVYDKWLALTHIGEPVPRVVDAVKHKIREGYTVKIFTARIHDLPAEQDANLRTAISKWCIRNIGVDLEVTCVKDPKMIELWDDRAVSVDKNTGLMVRYNNGVIQEL